MANGISSPFLIIGCGIPLDCIKAGAAALNAPGEASGGDENALAAEVGPAEVALGELSFFGLPTGRFGSAGGLTERAI